MSKVQLKAPYLFIDSVHKGCLVNEQHFFKTPETAPNDIMRSDFVHHYDEKSTSYISIWPEDNEPTKN